MGIYRGKIQLAVFFVMICFSSYSFAAGCDDSNLHYNNLRYAGNTFNPPSGTTAVCINKAESAAAEECNKLGNSGVARPRENGRPASYFLLNPNNPQYKPNGGVANAADQDAQNVARHQGNVFWCFYSNTAGAAVANMKRSACSTAGDLPENRNIQIRYINFGMMPSTDPTVEEPVRAPSVATTGDGDCFCRQRPQNGQPQTQVYVLCTNDRVNQWRTTVTREPTPAAPTNDDVKQCVDRWVEMSRTCSDAAQDAARVCRRNEQQEADRNRNNQQMSGMTMGLGQMAVNSMSGSLQECFMGSVALNAADQALRTQNNGCGNDRESCRQSCDENAIREQENKCKEKLQAMQQAAQPAADGVTPAATASPSPTAAYEESNRYYRSKISEVERNMSRGRDTCGSGSNAPSDLDKMLSGLGRSLQTSLQCMCQLSVQGGSTNCQQAVPLKQDCFLAPAMPGCQVYTALGVCTPGAGYDAAACNCQLNPKAPGCPGGSASGGLSNFGGGSLNVGGVGSTEFGSPGTKTALGGAVPIGGNDTGKAPFEVPKGGSDSGPTVGVHGQLSAGAAGGGAGGVSGLPPGATGEVAEEEPKGALLGAFTAAKNFVSRAVGGGNGDSKNRNRKSAAFNADKFKPRLRNVASNRGIGRKHEDIFKMINTCYNSYTCQANKNSFITAP